MGRLVSQNLHFTDYYLIYFNDILSNDDSTGTIIGFHLIIPFTLFNFSNGESSVRVHIQYPLQHILGCLR